MSDYGDERFYFLDINPEPWAIGPLYVGKHGGKMVPKVGRNQQLASFKEAVAEALSGEVPLDCEKYDLYFWFWRRLDSYETARGKTHTKHEVDSTNLQKATEDALQGVIIGNDRDVRMIGSEIIDQGTESRGCIVIRAREYLGTGSMSMQIPADIWKQVLVPGKPVELDNTWGYE